MSAIANGAIISDRIADILQRWQDFTSIENSELQEHLNNLCCMQDFFCRMLTETIPGVDVNTIANYLADIVCLKDDLKMFLPEKKENNETK